jgi:glucose-6-phosphate isomerase
LPPEADYESRLLRQMADTSGAAAVAPGTLPTTATAEDKQYFQSSRYLHLVEAMTQHVAYTRTGFPVVGALTVAQQQELSRVGLNHADNVASLSTSPEWLELQKEHELTVGNRITALFEGDAERFNDFQCKIDLGEKTATGDNFLMLDYSKTNISRQCRTLLAALAKKRGVEAARDAMMAGDAINVSEKRAVLHTALRYQGDAAINVEGADVVPGVKAVLQRMKKCTDAVRSGEWKGQTGKRIAHIVNIGIGGSDLGPVMATGALAPYVTDDLTMHYVSNIDGSQLAATLKKVDFEATLFIIASKTFTTAETLRNANSAKEALLAAFEAKGIAADGAIAKHFVAVSTNKAAAEAFGIDAANNTFEFWDWVGGRYSLWSAIGLPVMMAVGYETFTEMQTGAYLADEHFKSAALEENLPAMLALVGVWHNNFCGYHTYAVLPYSQHLHRLPAYLQQLDMESNGKSVVKAANNTAVDVQTGPILFGEPGTNGQHAFYQLIHQGTKVVPCDFIGTLETHDPLAGGEHHKMLMANMFAQAEALMIGKNRGVVRGELADSRRGKAEAEALVGHMTFSGNRPSNTMLVRKLTPRALGALIASYEHKIFVQGQIWGVNSFDQFGVELGKVLANNIMPTMRPGGVASTHDASTNGLINMFTATLAAPSQE